VKVKIDGQEKSLNIKFKEHKTLKEILRLVEFKCLFPDKVIKKVEIKGKPISPDMLDYIEEFSDINIITDTTLNFLKRHIEFSIIALDSIENAVESVMDSLETSEELAKLHINYIVDSLLKTVEILEKGNSFFPIVNGSDEAIIDIEEKIIKLSEMEEKEEIVNFLQKDFIEGVEKWKDFLFKVLITIETSSRETH